MLNISFNENTLYANEAIAVLINDQLKIDNDDTIIKVDRQHHGIISKIIQDGNKFKGNLGQTLSLTTTDVTGHLRNIILVGLGEEAKLKSYQLEEVGGHLYSAAKSVKANSVGISVVSGSSTSNIGQFQESEVAASLASGGILASYKFDKYQTKHKEGEKPFATSYLNIIVSPENKHAAYDIFEEKKSIAMGVYFARDLVSEPANTLHPESYAEQIVQKLEPLGVDIEVLGEAEMTTLGMGALLAVGQGSRRESKLVVMKYNCGEGKPVCFVGKGVTFDAGGISIKPSANMGDMKFDMGGSAAVVGAMQVIASRKAKVNVVGIVGLVENMPDGNAYRPGDVVTSMSGQTIEVGNTDAEGRLVLCDCVTYLQKNFTPDCIIDLATLTGAIMVALAYTYAGCFTNDDELAEKLIRSSHESNEKLWRMPLHKDFDEMIKSPIADMANIGSEGRLAGSSTAAHFIGRFIQDDVKWAHLDIAGMAWHYKGKHPICPVGAVGFGVRLLNQFVKDHYE